MSSLNSSPTDSPCCWPIVDAVATVTVPFTLVASPVTLFSNSSNLALSVEPVIICLKNTLFVLNPTFSVDNPIKSSFIFYTE